MKNTIEDKIIIINKNKKMKDETLTLTHLLEFAMVLFYHKKKKV